MVGLIGMDPGGEFYVSRTQGQCLAEGIWIDASNVFLVNSAPVGFRSTRYAIKFTLASGGQWVGYTLGGNYQDMVVSFANYNSSSAWVNGKLFFGLTDVGTHQTGLATTSSGQIQFIKNAVTFIGSPSSNVLTPGGHHFEVYIHIATGTAGSAQVYVDGTSWLSISGVNTQQTANAYANRFYLQPVIEDTDQYFKDIIWRNDNTFWGDIPVVVCYPNAAGPLQQWTPSAGTQVACVQDGITHTGTVPNDADYISDATSGHISDFVPQTISVPAGGSVKGLVHVSRLSKDDVGSRTCYQRTKSGSTAQRSALLTLGSSPFYWQHVMEKNPDTGTDWTQTTVNNATHGAELP